MWHCPNYSKYCYICGRRAQESKILLPFTRSPPLPWFWLDWEFSKPVPLHVILDAKYPAKRLIDCLRQVQPKAWIQMEAAGARPPALEEFVTASGACRLALPQTAAAGSNLLRDFSAECGLASLT
jgi:hypothetical protein